MQTIAGNRSSLEENEYKDQTSEIVALKTEMSLLKKLILRLVGHLYQVLFVVSKTWLYFICNNRFLIFVITNTDNIGQQDLCRTE